MFIARRQQKGFKVEGGNENFLKSEPIDIPSELSDLLPNMGIRLALRHSTGFYKGVAPYMVSVYLVPRNGAESQNRVLVETLVLSYNGDKDGQLDPLREKWHNPHPTAKEVRLAVHDYNFEDILNQYVDSVVSKELVQSE